MSAPARAEALVLAWARRYTRGLPQELAERRLLELASDCFEQRRRGREVGAHPRAVATSMVVRTLAGVPADLAWRHQALAVHRGRPLSRGGRPMGRWIKDNWWVAIGGTVAAMTVVLGFLEWQDDRTVGSALWGGAIATLGLVALGGVVVRRRPGRRAVGDLMIAGGQLPWIPFFWTVVPPILALVVMVAAFVDISDASTTGNDTVDGAVADGTARVTVGLLVALVVGVTAAVVIADPGFALTVPTPLALLVLVHLGLGRRLAGTPLVHAGGVLLVTPLLWFFTIVVIGTMQDGYAVDGAYELVVEWAAVTMLVVGAGLVVEGVRRGRPARPA